MCTKDFGDVPLTYELALLSTETMNDVYTPHGDVGVITDIQGAMAYVEASTGGDDAWYYIDDLVAGHDLVHNGYNYGVLE